MLTVSAPMMGGVIVTFATWRVIYWVQVGMCSFGVILAVFFIPDTLHVDENGNKKPMGETVHGRPSMLQLFNPMEIIEQLKRPAVILSVGLSAHTKIS